MRVKLKQKEYYLTNYTTIFLGMRKYCNQCEIDENNNNYIYVLFLLSTNIHHAHVSNWTIVVAYG